MNLSFTVVLGMPPRSCPQVVGVHVGAMTLPQYSDECIFLLPDLRRLARRTEAEYAIEQSIAAMQLAWDEADLGLVPVNPSPATCAFLHYGRQEAGECARQFCCTKSLDLETAFSVHTVHTGTTAVSLFELSYTLKSFWRRGDV